MTGTVPELDVAIADLCLLRRALSPRSFTVSAGLGISGREADHFAASAAHAPLPRVTGVVPLPAPV